MFCLPTLYFKTVNWSLTTIIKQWERSSPKNACVGGYVQLGCFWSGGVTKSVTRHKAKLRKVCSNKKLQSKFFTRATPLGAQLWERRRKLPLNVLFVKKGYGNVLSKIHISSNFSYRDQHWQSHVGIHWNCCDSSNVSAYHHKHRRKLFCLCRY